VTTLVCTDTDPEHIHDEGSCCECGSPEHCCGACPVYVGTAWGHDAGTGTPFKRFHIDSLEGPSAVEEFARDLFGSDTTVGIRDEKHGGIILYCHESMARKMVDLLENGELA
jgi:hypothetical protein